MNRLMPIVQASDLDRSIAFYGALGFAALPATRGPNWVELDAGDARLALHRAEPAELLPAPGRVWLGTITTGTLEEVIEHAWVCGVEPATGIIDEAWGRVVWFEDPDGLRVSVDERNPEFHPT